MTEITLNSRRRIGDDRASRRRSAKLAGRLARPPVARRPGDLERHQSDPLSGRRLDAERGGAGRGRRYPLGLHGFSRFETFALEATSSDFARLTLNDNARTRAVYPFAFALALEYRLSADALAVAIEVANPGPGIAPYACGLHPGFRWPLGAGGREGALVRFDKAEQAEVPRLAPGGLIREAKRPIPLQGRDLPLTDALFAHDALCFLNCSSRSLAFIDASGASITMDYPSFPHAALWTRPGAPFLCLEAWTGYSDPDGFEGDLIDKPGMRALEPGARARHEARFVFRPE